jgi:hypothetical protein
MASRLADRRPMGGRLRVADGDSSITPGRLVVPSAGRRPDCQEDVHVIKEGGGGPALLSPSSN